MHGDKDALSVADACVVDACDQADISDRDLAEHNPNTEIDAARQTSAGTRSDAHLILEHKGKMAQFTGESDAYLTLGDRPNCDLQVEGTHTSGLHAYIEFRNNDFYLVDCSTNGTFVQTEDEQVSRVHRTSVRLWGSGWLALGEPLHAVEPIRFKQV